MGDIIDDWSTTSVENMFTLMRTNIIDTILEI